MTKLRQQKGFTLIELLIVIAVLGIIAAIAIPNFTSVLKGVGLKADKESAHLFASEVEKEFMLGKIAIDAQGTAIVTFDDKQGFSGNVPSAHDKSHQYLTAKITKVNQNLYHLRVYYDNDTTLILKEQDISPPLE